MLGDFVITTGGERSDDPTHHVARLNGLLFSWCWVVGGDGVVAFVKVISLKDPLTLNPLKTLKKDLLKKCLDCLRFVIGTWT